MAKDDQQRLAWAAAAKANLGQLGDLHGIVAERAERLATLEGALKDALERVGKEKSDEGEALKGLADAAEDAVRRARLVGVKLEAGFLEGKVDEAVYRAALAAAFPRGPQSMGATPGERHAALRSIVTALEEHTGADEGGALAELARQGSAAIEAANEAAKREQAEHREANDALARARAELDTGYLATREIVTGLLRDAGRVAEVRDVFPDA